MTIHPLPSFGDRDPVESVDDCDDVGKVDGAVDGDHFGVADDAADCDVEFDDRFDDDEGTDNRFGGLDPSSTLAHRIVIRCSPDWPALRCPCAEPSTTSCSARRGRGRLRWPGRRSARVHRSSQ